MSATLKGDDGSDGADLHQLGNDLRIAVGRIVRRFRLGDLEGRVTMADLSVLARLDRHGPLLPSELAEQERITAQAISGITRKLESQGLVSRAVDAHDRRRILLSATAAGSRLLLGRRSRNAGHIAQAIGDTLTPEEQAQLAKAIPLLDRLTERL